MTKSIRNPLHVGIPAICLAVLLLPASSALGQSIGQSVDPGATHSLRVGKLYTFGGGDELAHGFGLDLRYSIFPEGQFDGFFGVFGNGTYDTSDAFRFAGGLTLGWSLVGLELGVSHRTATAGYAGSTGLSIGQTLTFGPLMIGGRLTIPLVDHVPQNVADTPAVQGFEGAVTVSLGFDFTLMGQRRGLSGQRHHHCRPRDGGRHHHH